MARTSIFKPGKTQIEVQIFKSYFHIFKPAEKLKFISFLRCESDIGINLSLQKLKNIRMPSHPFITYPNNRKKVF